MSEIAVAHAQYKDSGVQWLGKIPTHWEVKRVKDISNHVKTGRTPAATRGDFHSDGTENWFTPSDINSTGLLSNSSRKLTLSAVTTKEVELFKEGSIYIIGIGATIGKVSISTVKGSCNQQINVICPSKEVVGRYAFYQILVTGSTLLSWCNYNTMPVFTQTATKNLPFALPPFSEQKQIAEYLDRHTAAIDRKIDLLGQKIKLYHTLRKTLINETVCRGLHPHAPRKASGIEWIGQIPAHWQVKRLKDVGRVVLGKMLNTTGKAGYELKPYLKSKNVTWLKPSVKSVDDMYFSPDELLAYRIKKNDLLVSEGGEVGKTCIWNDELPECYIQNSVHKITMLPGNSPQYYLYLSFAMGAVGFYDSIVNQVSIKHLTWEKFIRVLVLVPPYEEQQAIAEHIAQGTRKIDAVITNLTTQIATLKELRKTLINDVVTGKLNVTA